MPLKIFAFIGVRGSGKDTAANLLQDLFEEKKGPGILMVSFAFADILKEMVHTSIGITSEQGEYLKRYPSIKPINGLSLREFYNQFGDALKSQFGNRIFTENTITRIKDAISSINPDIITVTDVRYPMEKAALQKMVDDYGMELITIKMINTSLFHNDEISHESETQIDDIESMYTITAKTPKEIQIKIEEIYNELY